ncbi:MAG: hypothetical protein ACTSSG_09715 [Candidatus Heimdallarchaeaceae archaeon]
MSEDTKTTIADHFLSLIEKKNIWGLEIISSIINIDSIALAAFIKTLPMAYGLYVQGDKLSITPELVRDVKEELKEIFMKWYETTAPDKYSQKQTFTVDQSDMEIKRSLVESQHSKLKLTVYGENYLTQKVIDKYLGRNAPQPSYKYVGGYELIDFEKEIGNEIYNCQFNIINYNRDTLSLAPLLFEQPSGFLFIFNPLDPLQIERIRNMSKLLIQRRSKEIFVSYLAIIEKEENERHLDEISEILSLIVENLEDKMIFKVSFAILISEEHIERKINDIIQTINLINEN